MDERIAIRGIRVSGRHGADPGERDRLQPFDVDVELDFDFSQARVTDDLHATVDYAAVHRLVVETVENTSYVLLERLADEILLRILRDERVATARVTIAKPGILDGATPSVTLSAGRT